MVFTLHLFAGAGGGLLADKLLGFQTVGAVEIDEFARNVLLSRQADGFYNPFPIWDDIRSFGIDPDTESYFERLRGIRTRLCIAGGFPCQDISAAGKGRGIAGEKSGLWKEFSRVIRDIRPYYVFIENSPLLIRRGIDVIIKDLASSGYSLAWRVISAGEVGAPHLRKRFWGLAISDELLQREREREREIPNSNGKYGKEQHLSISVEKAYVGLKELREFVSYSLHDRIPRLLWSKEESHGNRPSLQSGKEIDVCSQWGNPQSRMGRVDNGVPNWLYRNLTNEWFVKDEFGIPRISTNCKNRTKRLKAIGNAQVPICAAIAFEILLKDFISWTK